MILKYGSSPDADEEDYALYAVDNEGNSSVQVGYVVFILLITFLVIIVDSNTIFPCCAGSFMYPLDVIVQTNIFVCPAQT